MTDHDDRRTVAEANAIIARHRVRATLSELAAGLAPRRLAKEAVDDVAEHARGLASDGVKVVRRHPLVTLATTALALVLIARRPAGRMLRKRGKATRPRRRS